MNSMFGSFSRMRSGLIVSLLCTIAICMTSGVANAANVTLDGQAVTPVYARNGHLLIPFRAPMERTGAVVAWNNPVATASKNAQQLVSVTMGSTHALINGTPHTLSVAPQVINGAAFVPVEALTGICGAHVAYSADRTSATVTGCTEHLNALAAPAPVAVSATPAPAPAPSFNWWPWLIAALVILAGLWALTRNRAKTVYTSNPYSDATGTRTTTTPTSSNVVRGTIDDYVARLKGALNQMDNSGRASFVQQLSQTFKENRSTIPDSLVTSTRSAFDASASGSPGAVSSLIDAVADRPQLLQIAVKKFAALHPGQLTTLADSSTARL
ncbi:MAG: copper amine oxidase N-terminal domain-containing protein [Candidatus Eremiobacteraeota bacterium]|nr:copper amine oxidase N-terminal domain-containing protein [Candidatus Eremiobacteraeota bacterium]